MVKPTQHQPPAKSDLYERLLLLILRNTKKVQDARNQDHQ
jgi:hypothetical protein